MTGRLALLIVVGLAMASLYVNASLNTTDAVDNFVYYYNRSKAYDIALSGANLAGSTLYFDKTFRDAHFRNGASLEGGTLNVSIQQSGTQVEVVSRGTYPVTGRNQETIEVKYRLSNGYFDKYVVLTDDDPGSPPWTTGDTANGNLHSNNTLTFSRYSSTSSSAVLNGKVTTTKKWTITNGAEPVFTQIPESGVTVPFPAAFDPVTEPQFRPGGVDVNQTYYFQYNGTNQSITSHRQLHLQFYVDAMTGLQMVKYFRFDNRLTNRGIVGSPASGYYGDFRVTDSVVAVPASGIIYAQGQDVLVEGTIRNKVSVISIPDAGGNGGNIIITNDLRCETNPRANPSSPDYIGLLADKNVLIGNTGSNGASSSNRFRIEASIVALNGGLGAIDNVSRSRQILDIYGSITQKKRLAVGSGSGTVLGVPGGGFMKGYYYDARLLDNHALLMPTTPTMALDSWHVRTIL